MNRKGDSTSAAIMGIAAVLWAMFGVWPVALVCAILALAFARAD